MAKSGLANLPIGPILIIIVGIIVILYILKNKNFLRFGSPVTAVQQLELLVPGPNVYPVVGQITPPGSYGLSTASDGDGEPSYRDNVIFDCSKCNRETTWFVIPGNPGESGMDFSVGGSEQECPESFASVEPENCYPKHPEGCPEGYHGTDDDETGQCYPNDGGCKGYNQLLNMISKLKKITSYFSAFLIVSLSVL